MSKYDMRLVTDNPKINKRRSYIPNLSHKSQIDFNPGFLVPLDRPWEILPGDTWKVKHSLKIRMTNPPKVPVMDQLVLDLYYFYVPFRIVWTNFDKFITGDTGTDWEKISDLTVPLLEIEGPFVSGDLLDFLGVYHADSTNSPIYINALPIRGYYDIWNWYFRYEPLQEELYFSKGNSLVTYDHSYVASSINDPYDNAYFDYMDGLRSNAVENPLLAPVNKLDDYFTRVLPKPQAGPDINILGLNNVVLSSGSSDMGLKILTDSNVRAAEEFLVIDPHDSSLTGNYGLLGSSPSGYIPYGISGQFNGVTGNTIRDLRMAFALDSLLTIDARYGRRINEYTIGHYGVTVPDFRVDMPEFLSHKRIYINVNQVIQSSSTTVDSPQGNVGAWSETVDSGFDFVKSFVEHGLVYSLGCVRVLNRTYSQGLDKMFTRNTRFDFYIPALANISDTPVYINQLYDTLGEHFMDVFGYQEAWAEYKYLPNHVANHMRPQVQNTLAIYNYAEYYASVPTLSEAWIIEPASELDRTMYLEASSTVSHFVLDIYYNIEAYRTMPLHSLPGTLTNSW